MAIYITQSDLRDRTRMRAIAALTAMTAEPTNVPESIYCAIVAELWMIVLRHRDGIPGVGPAASPAAPRYRAKWWRVAPSESGQAELKPVGQALGSGRFAGFTW